MERLSDKELAERAGVRPAFVRHLGELGILAPDDEGPWFRAADVRRIRLLEACERAGLPLDGIGNEVLVSEDVRQASGAGGIRFHDVGSVELKNVSRPVRLYRASRA